MNGHQDSLPSLAKLSSVKSTAVQKFPAIPQNPRKAVQCRFKKRLVITHEHFLSRQGGFNRIDSI